MPELSGVAEVAARSEDASVGHQQIATEKQHLLPHIVHVLARIEEARRENHDAHHAARAAMHLLISHVG